MTAKDIPAFEPNKGRAARFTPQGLAEDGFVPTTMFQLAEVRNHGARAARELGVDTVRFPVKWTHQFESAVTVNRDGFIVGTDGVDLSPDQLWREVQQIQG